jgi:hypothetical protein
MQKSSEFPLSNGVSQARRSQQALDPDTAPVDERSVKDLLVFAQKYATQLRYFNANNEAEGDWSHFLGDNDLDQIAACLDAALSGNAQSAALPDEVCSRPHLVLFLTFLELLQSARTQLNDLTRRHLDFYYHEALRLTSQQAVPDQAHVLVTLAEGQPQYMLPAGTVFNGGQDSLGRDLLYSSEQDLLVNQASVASIKTLFSEKMTIGIGEARQTPDLLLELFPSNKDLLAEGRMRDRAFMAMLVMTLGTPGPGGALPLYPVNRAVTVSLLAQLDTLLAFVLAGLYMPFSTFRSLMQLKLVQTQTDPQWDQVNNMIESAGKQRLTPVAFKLDRSAPRNFEKNLLAALGRASFGDMFNGLPEVDDIYDLYRRHDRPDIIEFIQQSLYMTEGDFTVMMQIVEEINARWRQIYEILRGAGRKKQLNDPTHQMQPPLIRSYDADKFAALVSRTLGVITYPAIGGMSLSSFDDIDREIIRLENYFHVTAEEFVTVRAINQKQDAAQPWEWEQVYAILENAHADKVLADRRNALKDKRQSQGFQTMIRFALGDPNPGDALPDGRDFTTLDANTDKDYITEKLFLETSNFSYLKSISAKVNASDEEWNNVYAITEKAQSRKRGTVTARAEVEKWNNLYAASDATQVQVTLPAEGALTTPRWRTFGNGDSAPQTSTLPGKIGFAITSPLLLLAEGTRTITLTLGFREAGFDQASIALAIADQKAFQFLLSSEQEMVPLQTVSIQLLGAASTVTGAEKTYQHALEVTLKLTAQAPPVAPLTVAPLIQTPWPILQMMLADIPDTIPPIGGPVKRYQVFQSLALEKLTLRVVVTGLTTLTLQNDDSQLDAKKPFEPFGFSPVAGNSFYIAHPELCGKRLDSISFAIDWLGAPDDFNAYYLGYSNYANPIEAPTSPIRDNSAFSANLKLYDNRSLFDVGNLQLFNAAPPKKPGEAQTNVIEVGGAAILKSDAGYCTNLAPYASQTPVARQVLDWPRYWQVELQTPDFQHALYPRAASGCAAKTKDGKATPFFINPPYTPKIKRLSMGYSASLEIDLIKAGVTGIGSLTDRLYHIEPFGYRDLAGYDSKTGPLFLPQFENEGELFIGIKNLAAPHDLSLLFQLAEGSADPDLAREPIQWQYLDGNQWQTLEEGQLLSDATNGLLNSGIIRFDLPAAQPGTVLPTDLYWMRAAIAHNCRSVADTVAIMPQAIRVILFSHDNAPDHFLQPLAAGRITSLVDPQTPVKGIRQPYSSFGGKSPELTAHFYTRVSERLRHKDRALTCWDYEHLVLEAFPGIFKVKCLPVGTSTDPRLADVIQVIVIPDIKGQFPFDPFEPKLPADMLLQIERYLGRHCAAWARFKVKNPAYVRLKIRLGVRLMPGVNAGYSKSVLNEELQRFLAPWAYDRSADIVFGGKINSSLIINFVEKRPYIDYVAGIKLFISQDGRSYTTYNPSGGESGFAPEAILVSDHAHQIDLITEESYEEKFFTGVDYLEIELDFQVASS